MTYIEGFVIPVREGNRERFIEVSHKFDTMLVESGARRILECWADDVPRGKQTDFYRAVDAQEGETVAFSWIEWPDKATRDRVHAEMQVKIEAGELDVAPEDMPFDGKRMIFGGFVPVVQLGEQA